MAIGYIYILSNPVHSDLLKIGYTRGSVEKRASELSTLTGVPSTFVIEYFQLTDDVEEIETLVHERLAQYRFGENREFFRTTLERAAEIIEGAIRRPTISYVRDKVAVTVTNIPSCRRCGFQFNRSTETPFCPKCGY